MISLIIIGWLFSFWLIGNSLVQAIEIISCANTKAYVNTTFQWRSGTYATTQKYPAACRYTLTFPSGTVLIININVNNGYNFAIAGFGTSSHGESGFTVTGDKSEITNYAFSAPATYIEFFFNVPVDKSPVSSNAFKAVAKTIDIVTPLNYYLDANEEPLIIPLKDFRAGAGLNFSATNEVVLAIACPTVDPSRLVSIHIYKDSKKLDNPIATLWELTQNIRRYIQSKNPLVYVALAYQKSNGVLVAMDSSRIKDMTWGGVYYNFNNFDNIQFSLHLESQVNYMTNAIAPALTLLVDLNYSSTAKTLNFYQGVWLLPDKSKIGCGYSQISRGNLTIYRGFPSGTVDEGRILKKDRDMVDFLYLEGLATTFIYRQTSPESSELCSVDLKFSTNFPYELSQLPYNGTITRYPGPEGNALKAINFYDLGEEVKYLLKLYDSPYPVAVSSTGNNSLDLMSNDEEREFLSRGLNMPLISGSIDFTIEKGMDVRSPGSRLTVHFFLVILIVGLFESHKNCL